MIKCEDSSSCFVSLNLDHKFRMKISEVRTSLASKLGRSWRSLVLGIVPGRKSSGWISQPDSQARHIQHHSTLIERFNRWKTYIVTESPGWEMMKNKISDYWNTLKLGRTGDTRFQKAADKAFQVRREFPKAYESNSWNHILNLYMRLLAIAEITRIF